MRQTCILLVIFLARGPDIPFSARFTRLQTTIKWLTIRTHFFPQILWITLCKIIPGQPGSRELQGQLLSWTKSNQLLIHIIINYLYYFTRLYPEPERNRYPSNCHFSSMCTTLRQEKKFNDPIDKQERVLRPANPLVRISEPVFRRVPKNGHRNPVNRCTDRYWPGPGKNRWASKGFYITGYRCVFTETGQVPGPVPVVHINCG